MVRVDDEYTDTMDDDVDAGLDDLVCKEYTCDCDDNWNDDSKE